METSEGGGGAEGRTSGLGVEKRQSDSLTAVGERVCGRGRARERENERPRVESSIHPTFCAAACRGCTFTFHLHCSWMLVEWLALRRRTMRHTACGTRHAPNDYSSSSVRAPAKRALCARYWPVPGPRAMKRGVLCKWEWAAAAVAWPPLLPSAMANTNDAAIAVAAMCFGRWRAGGRRAGNSSCRMSNEDGRVSLPAGSRSSHGVRSAWHAVH